MTSKTFCNTIMRIIGGKETSYVKQPAFGPHGFVSRLIIKVHCLHLNLHTFWHALFDGNNVALVDHLLGENTGQTGLAATVSLLLRETRDQNTTPLLIG